MSEVIRSSMSTIPADRWELAFGRKDVKDNVQADKAEAEVDTQKC